MGVFQDIMRIILRMTEKSDFSASNRAFWPILELPFAGFRRNFDGCRNFDGENISKKTYDVAANPP